MKKEITFKIFSYKYNELFNISSIDFTRNSVTYFRSSRIDYPNGDVDIQQGDFTEYLDDVDLIISCS